ncbi:heat shock 70 kDa protein 16 [Tanacetum coccineum]
MPKITGEGYYTCNVRVEYEWKPPRCACCKVFGHVQKECLKNIEPTKAVSMSNPFDVLTSVKNDVELGANGGTSNLASQEANSSGSSFWNVDSSSPSTTPIIEKIDKIEKLIIDGKVTVVDDEGKPLEKVVSSGDYDTEDESLLEQWKKSYKNDDYEYDPYDDDVYEGPDKLQAFCDNLDILKLGVTEMMSVIGFDVGNVNCVIAAAKRGGIDVLLNDEAKRESPAVVSFGDKQRFLGSAGAAFATANPKSTISQIKRLIGRQYNEPSVQEELKLLPFVTKEGPRGGILIELEYLKEKMMFTPVEILGMLFKHLKQIAEKNLESAVVDCVIGIPSYFTDLQRREYLDAATIAGLTPLMLMHDGTATALGYGMYKTDLSDKGPTIVVFVDIGHCDTQVTLAAFEQGEMKILSHTFDQNLGGRDFDELLFEHFAEQFKEQYKIDVHSNTRASIRLRASCEKLKKVLSANTEAPLSIECLIEDNDVKGIITREEFENLSQQLLERVTIPCLKAVEDSGISVDKIYTIELVGSGSRIPAIVKKLTLVFKKEPTRTLNASECVARGCALRGAMLSPTLQVQAYKILDEENFYSYLQKMMGNSRTQNLPVSENLDAATTKDELQQAQEREQILTEQDKKVEQTKDQRNTLESFVYDTRNKHQVVQSLLSSAYRSFATDSEKEGITASLQETEDWIYEDSDDDSDEPDYTSKLDDLKKLLDPIEKRYKDEIARAKETKAMRTLIEEYRSATELMSLRHKDEVNNECLRAEQWLNYYQQQEGFKNIDPIRWASVAQEAMGKLEWEVRESWSRPTGPDCCGPKMTTPLTREDGLESKEPNPGRGPTHWAQPKRATRILRISPKTTWKNEENIQVSFTVGLLSCADFHHLSEVKVQLYRRVIDCKLMWRGMLETSWKLLKSSNFTLSEEMQNIFSTMDGP